MDKKLKTEPLINEKWGTSKLPMGGVVPEGGSSKLFKTGDWRVFMPVLYDDSCTGCVKCYFVCPDDAIRMNEDEKPIFDLDYCKGCKLCADVCTPGAITMELELK
ncbi:MAG: 4Fe-4S dicluster-binding protein [Candidatus Kariarchaeaceae archaeon]|jgi:pyruvate ferredoxin oxidoreductase delta subunit